MSKWHTRRTQTTCDDACEPHPRRGRNSRRAGHRAGEAGRGCAVGGCAELPMHTDDAGHAWPPSTRLRRWAVERATGARRKTCAREGRGAEKREPVPWRLGARGRRLGARIARVGRGMGCARLAAPGPRERLAGALAVWADQGKSRAGPGGGGGRRGAQGTAWPGELGRRERGGAEGVFLLFISFPCFFSF
jgi:hypothetical protein